MVGFSTGNQSTPLMSKMVTPRNVAAMPKSTSSDSLDRLGQGMRKSNVQPVPTRPAVIKPAVTAPKNARDTSRVEILLAQKSSKHVFKAAEETAQSQATNKGIRQSAVWTDVQKAISQAQNLTPGNAAFAIHRLGCLNCFASRKRKADLAASGIVACLLGTAMAVPDKLDAPSLVLLLDGCARLQHPVPAHTLDSLALIAQRMTSSFDSLQLPLLLWAFSVLDFAPPVDLLNAFDNVIPQLAEGLSPQGVCLALCGLQAPEFCPSQQTLKCLSEQLHRMLPMFKPSEVACCLEAFSSCNYQPPAYIIAAVLTSTGQSLASNSATEPLDHQTQPSLNGHHIARADDGKSQGFLQDASPSSKMMAAVRSNIRSAEIGCPKSTASSIIHKSQKAEQVALP